MVMVSEIVSTVSSQLNDISQVRWTEDELVYWVNDAIKQIVILMPESNAVSLSVRLVEGTKQSIPTDGVRLIDVLRNMGVDGSSPSSPVRIIERDVLDAMRPTWHKDRTKTVAKNFVFDPRNPKTFFVYPPSSTQYVEIVYSKTPDQVGINDDLGVFDIYSAAIINYVLSRAYEKDTEEGSESRASNYEKKFLTAIGLFDQADNKVQPNRHAPPRNKMTGEPY